MSEDTQGFSSNDACRTEYVRRLEAFRERGAKAEELDRRIADARLVVFVLGLLGIVALSFGYQWGMGFVGVGLLGFIGLVVWHEKILGGLAQINHGIKYYEAGIARLDSTWHGQGHSGEEFLPDGHLYVRDLDIFGEGSLYQLLCRSESSVGRETLASWLLAAGTVSEIRRRQAASAELKGALDLREAVAACAAGLKRRVGTTALLAWGKGSALKLSLVSRLAFVMTSLLTIGAGVGLLLDVVPPGWLFGLLFAQWLVGRVFRNRVEEVLGAVIEAHQELLVVADLMEIFERHAAESGSNLDGFIDGLGRGADSASRMIRELTRRVDLADAMRNQLFAPVGFVLFWNLHSAASLEAWRAKHGESVRVWLRALGELEALSSLSCYSFENPADVVPTFIEGERVLTLQGVAHPLLDVGEAVRNSVELGKDYQLIMVSGSNMSGKSTMLRTVGINLVLAQAGATVRAQRMVTSVFQIGGTLSIHDSLQLGASRFYAEILRIGALVEVTQGDGNLLFLLDEILHGTNSHDRRIGAFALLEALLERGAMGLVSTHDLALTEEVGKLSNARNVHFSDRLDGDRLVFDYRLSEGVVSRSNAIELMRSVGLPV